MVKRLMDSVMYRLGYSYRYGSYRRHFVAQEKKTYCGKRILSDAEANHFIAKKVAEGKPFMAARMGGHELRTTYHHYLTNKPYSEQITHGMFTFAGFFPADEKNLTRFAELMFSSIKEVDVMGIWFYEGEEEMCQKFCPDAEFVYPKGLEPYYFPENPWSQHLAGKKVLVIHPFEDSIKQQYAHNRTKLFATAPKVLPEFELKTIKAVQSVAGIGAGSGFATWFDAYDHMCNQMVKTDYDVAIIGAGAYGFPLAGFAKQQGKQAIHMGGATQLLFGVLGQRWMDRDDVNHYFNDSWKRPSPHETPEKAQIVENACYW
jgi:hypothetical protein